VEPNPETPRDGREVFCYMTASGVYPKMRIKDIKCSGSAATLSQDYFWKLLSVDQFNTALNNEPDSDELVYSIATRQEANRRQCGNNSKVSVLVGCLFLGSCWEWRSGADMGSFENTFVI
jgi:hypothetical protein